MDSNSEIEQKLVDYSKALKDYTKTGVKQCIAILDILLETDLTLTQLKESKIGASLSKIAKLEVTGDDEKDLKDKAVKLFMKCKQRESSSQADKPAEKSPTNGNGSGEKQVKKNSQEEKKANSDEKKPQKETSKFSDDPFAMETEPIKKNNNDIPKKEPPVEKKKEQQPPPKKSSTESKSGPVEKLPYLEPAYRNFTLKTFADALLMDFKNNPAEREKFKGASNRKAIELEKALNEKVKGLENEYRMEARNLSSFLILKNNVELRRNILENEGDCREFVYNKENFMNQAAREKLERNSKRLIDAANADYDKTKVRDSALYQCKVCKSKKITKMEKQTRSGDEPMTSFFQCADCGKGWKE